MATSISVDSGNARIDVVSARDGGDVLLLAHDSYGDDVVIQLSPADVDAVVRQLIAQSVIVYGT